MYGNDQGTEALVTAIVMPSPEYELDVSGARSPRLTWIKYH